METRKLAKTYTRIAMYDFDGTLFRSWEATPKWWAGTELDKGPYSFFTRSESLGPPCVPEKPPADYWIGKAVSAARRDSGDRNVFVVVVTGRVKVHRRRVLALLKSKGINPQASYFNPGMSAATFKVAVLWNLLAGFPSVDAVDVWENENQAEYKRKLLQAGKLLDRDIEVTVHSIEVPPKPLVCGPQDFGLVEASARKVATLKAAGERPKYPRTLHLPWSQGRTDDDKVLKTTAQFEGKQVVVTEKMDGENCTIGKNYVHARSPTGRHQDHQSWVKEYAQEIQWELPDGWRLCGENMQAKHSIAYDDLPSFFMLFSIWDNNNNCLSWADTVDYAKMLGVKMVPVLYKGPWDEDKIAALWDKRSGTEGYVVRNARAFPYSQFSKNVGKFVRADHVQTGSDWKQKKYVPNKLIKQASAQRVATRKQGGVYKPMSEITPGTQDLLDSPTPGWLDRDYPYVAPPGKDHTLQELDYLVSLIPLREKWASFIKAADEDMAGLFVTLCSELGAPCDEEALNEVVLDSAILITKLKWLYNRPRPYQVAAQHDRLAGQGGIYKAGDLSTLDSKSAHTPAYPSGHTIQANLMASRLSEAAPQHRKAFMDLAEKVSFSRAVAGYHWPSDLVFGKDIFRHIVMPLMPSAVRVAKTFTVNKGDTVWYGKYKNQRGIVEGFSMGDKGDPLITVEQLPAPSARNPKKKSPKQMKLFNIRPRKKDEHDETGKKATRLAAKKYDHIDFVPPEGVANEAAKGLRLRQKASPSNKGGLTPAEASKEGIGSGVQRAVNLKNRDPVSPKVIKQMRGFLSRSEKSSEISEENRGTPWNDKGYVAWLLWGGDPAKAWTDKIIKQMDAADEKVSKKAAGASGDCYDSNGRYFMDKALFPGSDKSLRLVHGEVTGQGPLAGVNYGHCWIEDGNTVIDVSNGKTVRMPKAVYYALGGIDHNDNLHKYTAREFQSKVTRHEHWGPWDLRTSTGL